MAWVWCKVRFGFVSSWIWSRPMAGSCLQTPCHKAVSVEDANAHAPLVRIPYLGPLNQPQFYVV